MNVLFTANFPKRARPLVRSIVETLLADLGLPEWECTIGLTTRRDTYARIAVVPESHAIEIDLKRERIHDRATLEEDLTHEIFHVHDAELDDAISNVKNTRDRDILKRAYERAHDAQSRVIRRLVFGGP